MGLDIANVKTQKCHETGQIDFPRIKVYILVASKLRSFPTSPNSVLPIHGFRILYPTYVMISQIGRKDLILSIHGIPGPKKRELGGTNTILSFAVLNC